MNANDLVQYWHNGLPVQKIVQRFSYEGGVQRWLVQIGGQAIYVDPTHLDDRQIISIPETFKQVSAKLKELLLKLNSDPLVDQYNFDELLAKLDQLIGAMVQQQQLLTSVQWGKVVGSIQSQTDLNTVLATKLSIDNFPELFTQNLQAWLVIQHQARLP